MAIIEEQNPVATSNVAHKTTYWKSIAKPDVIQVQMRDDLG